MNSRLRPLCVAATLALATLCTTRGTFAQARGGTQTRRAQPAQPTRPTAPAQPTQAVKPPSWTQKTPDGQSDLQGYWSAVVPMITSSEGVIPPLSAEGQRRAAERAAARKGVGIWDSAQTAPFGARCLILDHSGPPMLSANYNNGYQFVQTPGYVTILVEMVHHARIIPIDGRPRMPGAVRQWTGSSRGHWEGETLVVETANFNGKFPIRGSSEQIRLTERFTRVDADTIRYQFTVDDPATWTKPWSAEQPMRKITGPIFEHACHEGNYDLRNLLTTARVLEKKAADEAAKKGSR